MSTRKLKPGDVRADILKQRRVMTGKPSQKKLSRMVIGPTMLTGVIMRFLTGKGPNDKPWKSGARNTKLGGRFSSAYNKRPSGRTVSGASIRNTDTGRLANSHTVKKATASNVIVGPTIKGKGGKAIAIMQREAGYGNYAVGWDTRLKNLITLEIKAFMTEIANGRTPRYLPKSRIRTRA